MAEADRDGLPPPPAAALEDDMARLANRETVASCPGTARLRGSRVLVLGFARTAAGWGKVRAKLA